MKWVTRENGNVDRIACPWLIKRFIDPEADFLFVPGDQVLEVAEREGAHSYDAKGAQYTHRDGKCSFDVLIEEFGLREDRPLSAWPRSSTPRMSRRTGTALRRDRASMRLPTASPYFTGPRTTGRS